MHHIAAALVCLGVAACQEPERAADYIDAFPLAVSMETVTLSLAVPGETGYIGQQAADFEGFVVDYHNRARGPVVVEAGADADRVRMLLVKAGIRPENISIAGPGAGAARGGTVTLSFAAHKVDVPECGQFTSKTTPNWTNRRHSNFGCATRRNLGLTVSDPGDLKEAKPMSPPDATRLQNVIRKHGTPPERGASSTATEGAKK
jgi:pilus assembly protein CpaD